MKNRRNQQGSVEVISLNINQQYKNAQAGAELDQAQAQMEM